MQVEIYHTKKIFIIQIFEFQKLTTVAVNIYYLGGIAENISAFFCCVVLDTIGILNILKWLDILTWLPAFSQ